MEVVVLMRSRDRSLLFVTEKHGQSGHRPLLPASAHQGPGNVRTI